MASVSPERTLPASDEPAKALAGSNVEDERSTPASASDAEMKDIRTPGETQLDDEEAAAKASEQQEDGFELPPRLVLDGASACEGATTPPHYSSEEEHMPECEESKMHADRKSALKRAKAQPWTEEEHIRFLTGLQKLGKGNWSSVSKYYVPTRTPAQVASHAQKHFMRLSTYYQCQGGIRKRKSRFSVLDSACSAAGSTGQRVLKPANGVYYQPFAGYGWCAAPQPKKVLPAPAWPEHMPQMAQAPPPGTTQYTPILPAIAPRLRPRMQAPPQPIPVFVPSMMPLRVPQTSLFRPMPHHPPVPKTRSSLQISRHTLQPSLHSAFQVMSVR
mmetsp:Transcript_20959/g.45957  ORF Transcript_20959/g.45957 Transcript_20959/m.45957 type:complete len:331 (-) Transcript_20959:404-1396(-)